MATSGGFPPGLTRYGVALLAVGTALLVRVALNPVLGDSAEYVTLFPAIALCAWYCGAGPSIFSIVLALLGAKYWLIPPVHSFNLPDTAQSIGILGFLLGSLCVMAMGALRHRENQSLRRAHTTLEDRVEERTAELNSANQNLRALTARLLQLQDEERRRFARELHDSVGQMLAALSMNLFGVRSDVERLAKIDNALSESQTLVQQMSSEVRTISHLLHPPLLDEAGLASALRWYVDGYAERSKIKVDLELPNNFERLSSELETTVFRLVQECLTNIHRHSGSAVARVRLSHNDGRLLVEVEDHGKGIPPEKAIEMGADGIPGVGIRGMRERVRQLGGDLNIRSDGKGTVVRASLPVPLTSLNVAA